MEKKTETQSTVKMTRSPVVIPTYVPHAADKNPVFHEKRAYQGASGKIYPIPVTDRLSHEKADKEYDSVTLENEYVKIMVLPEIGGRIHVGLDKTNGYNFIYHNTVIKPALIGIAGSWISGGIEFNWPQHHRPTTFMPVETALEENADGSKTAWVGEVEPLYGLKSMAGVTVCPGRSYLKVKVRAYNPTPFPQPFMWWANLGVHVDESYRIIFPQDVKVLAYHDRAVISDWPMVQDRFSGKEDDRYDGSWYKNHQNPGSFMVMDGSSDYNFIEGYDTAKQAGVVHVANHHVSTGKKLFTWGNGEFGQAWKGNLTDQDGHYVEMMTGVYTDNQPDFSWMQPNETRTFEQCWYPVKAIGFVKNATEDAAVSLEVAVDKIAIGYHATGSFKNASVVLKAGDRLLYEEKVDIDPANPFLVSVNRPEGTDEYLLWTALLDADGRELVSFRSMKSQIKAVPEARTPSPEPADIVRNEELYIHGLHIEQYRHHSLEASDYYLEALRRDPADIRCNNAMGLLHLKRGLFGSAEAFFSKAIERLTSRNTNPYDGEPLYNLGLAQQFLGKHEEAYKSFYKATWSNAMKSAAYHALAALDCRKGDFGTALENITRSLSTNVESLRSRNLKSAILRQLGRNAEAACFIDETIGMDLLDHWARFECYFATLALGDCEQAETLHSHIKSVMLGKAKAYLNIALEYENAGLFGEALDVLEVYILDCASGNVYPMAYYAAGYLNALKGDMETAAAFCRKADQACPDYCFPNRLESIAILAFAGKTYPAGSKAWYYLGNLLYDKQRFEEATTCWEKSRDLDGNFAIVHRNLAMAYFDKQKEGKKAIESMRKAYAANGSDSRLLFELLQVCKNANTVSAEERLMLLDGKSEQVAQRNDCYVEMLILLLQAGRIDEAQEKIMSHVYDIYEGGEGKLAKVYEWISLMRGLSLMDGGDFNKALACISSVLKLPETFHEGRGVFSSLNHIHYYMGVVSEAAGNRETAAGHYKSAWYDKAAAHYKAATEFVPRPGEATFYQGLAFRKLGEESSALQAFQSLLDAGETQVRKGGRYDFFATGVPTPMPFEGDREKLNVSEGLYMKALALIGLGRPEEGRGELEAVLTHNASHLGAWIHTGRAGKSILL